MGGAAVPYRVNPARVIRLGSFLRTIPAYNEGEEGEEVFCVSGMSKLTLGCCEAVIWYSDRIGG